MSGFMITTDGLGHEFSCTAWGVLGYPLDLAPLEYWRRIELHYPDGAVVALVYEREPVAGEAAALMWKLQVDCKDMFKVLVIDGDGTRTWAP